MQATARDRALDMTEAERRVHQSRGLRRLWLALRSGVAVALNPGDTQQVLIFSTALDGWRLARVRRQLETHPEGRVLIHRQLAIDSRALDRAWLRSLPDDSLGAAYVRLLDEQGLDPDMFRHSPGLPPDLAYVGQRIRQTHDLWHVLTGLGTDIPGEVALQAFSYAQLKLQFSLLIALFGCLIYGLRYPHMFGMARRWYHIGRGAPFLLAVAWEQLWTEPVEELRTRLGLTEARGAPPRNGSSSGAKPSPRIS